MGGGVVVLLDRFSYEPQYSQHLAASCFPLLFLVEVQVFLQRAVLHMADKEPSFAQKPAETPHHLSLSCKVGPGLID